MYCIVRKAGKEACEHQCYECQCHEKKENLIEDGSKYDIPTGACPESEDLINKPNHYHKGGIDIYEIMQAKFTPEEYRGFCKGNILKYLLREDMKGGVDDIKKLRFNADRLIENMNGEKYIPEYKQELLKVKG